MKKLMVILMAILFLAAAGYGQEESSESDTIGLTIGMDYNSNYLWRGTLFFGGDGAFLPSITYDVLGSGLVLSFVGEFSESYFFEGNKADRNAVAFANHGLDFGADYSYTFGEAITIGAGMWYYYYFNSGSADGTGKVDYSFLSANVNLAIDMLPLTPTFNVYYDYYTIRERGGDFYFTFGLSHEFELTDEVAFGLGSTAGYFYNNTADSPKKGFSDIAFSSTLTYSKGMVGFSTSFNYVIVPASSFYRGDDIHRFYTTFGATLSF